MAKGEKRGLPVGLLLGCTLLLGTVAGCSTAPPRSAPPLVRGSIDPARVAPAPLPKQEPASRTGNQSSYVVFGRRYRVMPTSEGYRERGTASWYGPGFHGRRTSSGDRYDMYAVSAAHKHLPIPTYTRVTNLENGQSLVVRVNDRGPFVGSRIIDLSYGAATQLGMAGQGTALVEVEALAPYQTLPGRDLEPGVRLAERIRPPRLPRAERVRVPAPVVAQTEPPTQPLVERPLQLVSARLDAPRPAAKVHTRTAPSPVSPVRRPSERSNTAQVTTPRPPAKPTKAIRMAKATVLPVPSTQSGRKVTLSLSNPCTEGRRGQGAGRCESNPTTSGNARYAATRSTAWLKPTSTKAGCSGRSCSTR